MFSLTKQLMLGLRFPAKMSLTLAPMVLLAAWLAAQASTVVGAPLAWGSFGLGLTLSAYLGISFHRSVLGGVKALRRHMINISMGELRNDIQAQGKDEFTRLLRELNNMQIGLRETVVLVQSSSSEVVQSSSEIAGGAQDLSSRVESAAAALEELAAALDQSSSVTAHTAESVAKASELALNNAVVAQRGGQVMEDVVSTMEHIQVSSSKINDIIGVIDGIAFQTNILALNGADRLTRPMLKQGGVWKEVDWQTALEYVANGLKSIKAGQGANAIGLLASPHSTVEELALAGALVRGLGSSNIDSRLRAADFGNAAREGDARWLGLNIAALSELQRVLVVGSSLRKDHPLFAQRIRQAVRRGAQLSALTETAEDWAMPVAHPVLADASRWTQTLAGIAAAVAEAKGVPAPVAAQADDAARAVAASLLSGDKKAVLLGNAAAHHAQASSLLALAQWIASQTGASFGYLTEAANTVGAQLVRALPGQGGLDARQMLAGGVKAALLLNVEAGADTALDGQALAKAEMVVTLSPFKTNLDISDVLLPIAPFSETSGSFVNAEGRLQSFHAVVKPLGETRPAWKVLRVLGNLLGLGGFAQESSQEVLAQALPGVVSGGFVATARLSNQTDAAIDTAVAAGQPCVAAIYQLDALVRRAGSLQLTADGRTASEVGA